MTNTLVLQHTFTQSNRLRLNPASIDEEQLLCLEEHGIPVSTLSSKSCFYLMPQVKVIDLQRNLSYDGATTLVHSFMLTRLDLSCFSCRPAEILNMIASELFRPNRGQPLESLPLFQQYTRHCTGSQSSTGLHPSFLSWYNSRQFCEPRIDEEALCTCF